MKNLLSFIGLILFWIYTAATAQTIDVSKAAPRTTINIVKRVDQDYYLLTKDRPIEFTVSGPTTIRVYSRLLWHDNMTDRQVYKLIISENGVEKISSFETQKSNSAIGTKKESYGKWRSFYLDVPTGTTNYKISLLGAKSDTVAVRFTFEKPMDYKKITPLPTYQEIQYVENEKTVTYYQVKTIEPIKLKVQGPVMVKATCRLNYDITLEGKQNFTISASVQDKEWRSKAFHVSKSKTGQYKNVTDVIPSTPVDFFISVPPGSYVLELNIRGTLATSAAMILYSKPLEAYE